MGIRSLRLVAAAAVAGAVPASGSAALANPAHTGFEFDGFAGGHFFSPNNELGARDEGGAASPDNAVAFGLRLGYWFVPMFGIEVEGEGVPTEAKLGTATSEQFIVGYRLNAVVQFGSSRVIPFVLAGVGGSSNSSERDDILLDDTDFSVHAGAGLKFAIGSDWGVRAEYRALIPPSSDPDKSLAFDQEGLIGLYTMFGGRAEAPLVSATADQDGDGVPDASDKCVSEPEDKDGFEDENGCPDPDNDGDGIADASDKCPMEPESMNQIDDADGCPEKDDDGDGVVGSADKCPNQAEDKDGFEDENGCPDPDNDADGVADANDKCPAESESPNGFQDGDGCPDEVPAAVQKFTGVIKGINFKKDSAELTRSSSRTLDAAVKLLQEYADLRLEVAGHTDNTGDAERNRALSQERADAVKAYLVSKGIPTDRLEAKGYGPDQPLADNATRAGQATNRRVEFTLLPGTPAAPGTQAAPAQPETSPAPEPKPESKPQ